jgi:hypothetical protein
MSGFDNVSLTGNQREYQMSAKKQLETTERFSPRDLPLSGEPFDDLSECARYYHREEIDTADFAS